MIFCVLDLCTMSVIFGFVISNLMFSFQVLVVIAFYEEINLL